MSESERGRGRTEQVQSTPARKAVRATGMPEGVTRTPWRADVRRSVAYSWCIGTFVLGASLSWVASIMLRPDAPEAVIMPAAGPTAAEIAAGLATPASPEAVRAVEDQVRVLRVELAAAREEQRALLERLREPGGMDDAGAPQAPAGDQQFVDDVGATAAAPVPESVPQATPGEAVRPARQTVDLTQPPSPYVPIAEATIRINVNTATQAELELLPGIGPALAKRILDDRAANGLFRNLTDLQRVRGIGPKTAEALRDQVRFE